MRGDVNAQPITNQCVDPKCLRNYGNGFNTTRWFGGAGATGVYSNVTGATDAPTGLTTYKRKTWTAFVVGSSNPADCGWESTLALSLLPGSPGSTITIGWWMRTSATGKRACLSVYHVLDDKATITGGRYISSQVLLQPNVWTFFSFSYTVPANRTDSVWLRPTPDTGTSSTAWTAGDTLDMTGVVYTVGTPSLPTSVDGSTPGWKWTGAADVSTSVGFPYTLESIAGTPVASITGLGSVALTLAQVPALSGRTIYVVTDRLALPGTGVAARFARGVLAQGGADLRSDGPSARYTYRPQYDGAGGGAGGAYSTGYIANVPAVGTRNVHCVAEMDGLTSYEHEVNGGAPVVKTGMVPGSGHTAPGLYTELGLDGTTTVESPVYAVQFVGGHSYETRKRVTAWLGRRYGSPIPAGY